MSYYLWILAVQSPFDIGVDPQNRPMQSVNFECRYQLSDDNKFEQEIASILSDASLVTLGTDTFIGRGADMPDSDPSNDIPLINIIVTGGSAPTETHDGDKHVNQTVQVVVRAISDQVAIDRANAIWRELDGKRGITVSV